MNTYFNPTAANIRGTTNRLATAYRVAGVTAPTTFVAELRKHLRTRPDQQQVAATIAHDAYNAAPDTDVTDFWDQAVDTMRTAIAEDALRHALTGNLEAEEHSSAGRSVDRALKDLSPFFDRTVKALTTAAKHLPAGAAALDPEVNLTANTGQHLTTARAALQHLATLASVPETNRYVGSVQGLAQLLPIVDFDKPVQEVATDFGDVLNAPKLTHTRTLRDAAAARGHDRDLLLVDIARGAYPGIRFAYANSRKEIGDRAMKARDAFYSRAPKPSEEAVIAMR